LIGSFNGASAPIFGVADHKGVAVAAATPGGTVAAIEKKNRVRSNARRMFIISESAKNSADPACAAGDLTPRKLHYQTTFAQRQLLAAS